MPMYMPYIYIYIYALTMVVYIYFCSLITTHYGCLF